MYICKKCGELYEDYPSNGCCHDYDIEVAVRCPECGEYKAVDEEMCPQCGCYVP